MAPYTNTQLSAAELSYLHTSLSYNPPLRTDGRTPTEFRPLIAESDIIPSANGSARLCFADGTEAIVGIKAEVEKTDIEYNADSLYATAAQDRGFVDVDMERASQDGFQGRGDDDWLEISIEIPGVRDDDALPAFLSSMLSEALASDGQLRERLWINRRFHWRLYIDILLLSQPLSYPLPLLSLSTHLALLSTRLPALISEHDEDPLFNDDWQAATPLYPPDTPSKPPITLLVMTVNPTSSTPTPPTRPTILYDPSREELAVADAVLAVSLTTTTSPSTTKPSPTVRLLSLRTLDPPSRLTGAGVPHATETTPTGAALGPEARAAAARAARETADASVWRPPRGGVSPDVVRAVVRECTAPGGVGEEILAAAGKVGA